MAHARTKKIIDVARTLLGKYESEKENLDELQKAQIVQALVRSKLEVGEEIKTYDPSKKEAQAILDFFKEIDETTKGVDLPKLKVALESLSIGIEEMIKRSEAGEVPIKE